MRFTLQLILWSFIMGIIGFGLLLWVAIGSAVTQHEYGSASTDPLSLITINIVSAWLIGLGLLTTFKLLQRTYKREKKGN